MIGALEAKRRVYLKARDAVRRLPSPLSGIAPEAGATRSNFAPQRLFIHNRTDAASMHLFSSGPAVTATGKRDYRG